MEMMKKQKLEQGLHKLSDGQYAYLFGNEWIPNVSGLNSAENCEFVCKECKPYTREELKEYARMYMEIMPGVSDVIFYYVLITILAEFLALLEQYPEMTLYVTGAPNSFKTSLSVKATDVFLNHKTEVKFYDLKNVKKDFERFKGTTVVADDYFKDVTQHGSKTRTKQLNELSRLCDRRVLNRGIIVTAEFVPDDLLPSGRDRAFCVETETLSDEEFQSSLAKIREIPNDFMTALSKSFIEILMKNFTDILDEMEIFFRNYSNPMGITYTTRVFAHIMYLSLGEHIYCKYYCNGDKQQSCGYEFNKRIVEIALKQQRAIMEQKRKQLNVDLILTLYYLLDPKLKYFEMCESALEYDYTIGKKQVIYKKGYYYIRKEFLGFELGSFIGCNITYKELTQKLDPVLVYEGSSPTVSLKPGGRHYKMSWYFMRNYLEKRYENVETEIEKLLKQIGR